MHRVVVLLCVLACGSGSAPSTSPANRTTEQAGEGVQYVGDPNARVRIDYYFDYECPHCVTFAPTIDELGQHYGNRIVVYYRNFQLAKHPNARLAAISVEAARRQGKFLTMHRLLFKQAAAAAPASDEELMAALRQRRELPGSGLLTPEALRRDAAEIGLDLARYDADIKDPAAAARVDGEYAGGEKRELDHVPSIFINDVLYEGDTSGAAIGAAIDARL